jgi:hypothetical protein
MIAKRLLSAVLPALINVIGIRANATGALSNIPPLTKQSEVFARAA